MKTARTIFLVAVIALGAIFGVLYAKSHVIVAEASGACADGITLTNDEARNAFFSAHTISISLQKINSDSRVQATVTNNTGCKLPVSLLSYQMFDTRLSTQKVFSNSGVVTVNPNSTQTLTVDLPNCMAQADLYYGEGPTQLRDDNYYGKFTLAYLFNMNNGHGFGDASGNFCTVQPQKGCITVHKETFDPQGNSITPVAQFTFRLDNGVTIMNNADGNATFQNVSVGTHTVTEDVPNGWTNILTTPSNGTVNVTAGSQCAAVVFKNRQNQTTQNLSLTCSANPGSTSVNLNVTFTANPSGGTGNYSYSWSGTDGLSGSSQSVNHSYSYSGTKNATVTVNSGSQSATATCSTYIYQNQTNDLGGYCYASPSSVRTGDNVTWYAVGTGGNGNYSYSWSGWDDLNGYGSSISKSYSYSGQKSATVAISSGGQTVYKTCYVDISNYYNNNLSGYCTTSTNSAGTGDLVTWTAYPSGGNGNYSYSWSGTDNLYSGNQSVTRSYDYSGQKTATVTIYSNGMSTTQSCSTYIQNRNNNITYIRQNNQGGGVYLNQVPYTGIGSNAKVAIFIGGLFVWSSIVAYLIIKRRANKAGMKFSEYVARGNGKFAFGMSSSQVGKSEILKPKKELTGWDRIAARQAEKAARMNKQM